MRIRSRPPKIFDIVRKDYFFIFGTFWTTFTCFLSFFIIKDNFDIKDMYNQESILSIVFAFIFSLVGLLMIYFPLKRAVLIKHLHEKGTNTKATITDITVTVITNDQPSHCSVKYIFKYRDQKEYKGKTGLIPINNTKDLKVGNHINILYDPKNPNKTIWLDGCF